MPPKKSAALSKANTTDSTVTMAKGDNDKAADEEHPFRFEVKPLDIDAAENYEEARSMLMRAAYNMGTADFVAWILEQSDDLLSFEFKVNVAAAHGLGQGKSVKTLLDTGKLRKPFEARKPFRGRGGKPRGESNDKAANWQPKQH